MRNRLACGMLLVTGLLTFPRVVANDFGDPAADDTRNHDATVAPVADAIARDTKAIARDIDAIRGTLDAPSWFAPNGGNANGGHAHREMFQQAVARMAAADARAPTTGADSQPASPPHDSIKPIPDAEIERAAAALRKAAWKLEVAAHILENAHLYDDADATRRQADALRQSARRMWSKW